MEKSTPPPLTGIRVLDVSTVLAAPLTAALLGELGADVIKVEQPGRGDPARQYPPLVDGTAATWEQHGLGKRSVAIDLHTSAGIDLLHSLIKECEIVITNFRPPTLARFGLEFDDLTRLRKDVVMLHLTAFGRTGPYSDLPGFARVVEAFAGLTHRTGHPDGSPMFSGYPIADGVGGIYGAFAVMSALRQRDLTGQPQLVDLGLYEPMLRMMEDSIPAYQATGASPGRIGNDNPSIVPNGLFRTRDDRWVVLPVSTDQMWQRLVKLLDNPELSQLRTMEHRLARRSEVNKAVSEFVASHDLDELLVLLHGAGLAAGPVNTAEDIVRDQHIVARGSVLHARDRHGRETLLVAPAGRYSGFDHVDRSPAPEVGEHTNDILGGLVGLPPGQIDQLRDRGVIQ
ncbi:CaiB/BaiF CoA transferase family protein [Arthrobacter mobilis]|uniref:CoA transferase n=1 Tax=Arthrobacter mobilis TaxID=2724944 RepID=A0A7X6K6B7_9MICC|nr:CoA transferase [Arthrobacter mobilis]NKX54743.1 CoA transferase [Arthrobacter mobilis]